jgi:hypothetical protein
MLRHAERMEEEAIALQRQLAGAEGRLQGAGTMAPFLFGLVRQSRSRAGARKAPSIGSDAALRQ